MAIIIEVDFSDYLVDCHNFVHGHENNIKAKYFVMFENFKQGKKLCGAF